MIICIMGVSCVGKTTLIKNIIKRYKFIKRYKPIEQYFTVKKYEKFLVIQRTRLTQNQKNEVIQILQKEVSNNKNIILDVDKVIDKDFLYWIIDNNHDLKIFHITASKTITDYRAKKRGKFWDKHITENTKLRHREEMYNLMEDSKIKNYVIELPNTNEKENKICQKNISTLLIQ